LTQLDAARIDRANSAPALLPTSRRARAMTSFSPVRRFEPREAFADISAVFDRYLGP
jgi:hypothetical protein